jgi:hypothetical protein
MCSLPLRNAVLRRESSTLVSGVWSRQSEGFQAKFSWGKGLREAGGSILAVAVNDLLGGGNGYQDKHREDVSAQKRESRTADLP